MGSEQNKQGAERRRPSGSYDEILAVALPVRPQLEQLLAERRYEEALDLLHSARWHAPDAVDISRGINLLKERLIRQYLARIGNLDAVPCATADVDHGTLALTDEERTLLRLIDNVSSFGDIAHQSLFGRFETYRALDRFVREGIITMIMGGAEPTPPPPSRRTTPHAVVVTAEAVLDATTEMEPPIGSDEAAPMLEPAPAPPRSRPWRLPAVGLASALIAAGAWIAISNGVRLPRSLARAAPALHAQEPATPASAGAAAGTGVVIEPIFVPDTVGDGEPRRLSATRPAAAAPAPTPTAGASPAAGRTKRRLALAAPAGSATKASDHAAASKGAPRPVGAAAAVAAPQPAEAAAAPEPAAKAKAEEAALAVAFRRPAPSLPDEPPAVPARASAPAPRPAPTAAFALADVSASAGDIKVSGPLSRSVVEHAVARAQAGFRACYAIAATAARRNADGAVRVTMAIDETGQASAVSAQGGPLPGIAACVQEAARQIRTRQPPDVGVATVAFNVAFSATRP